MNLKDQLSRDHLIHSLGLDREVRAMDTILPALGIFSAGLLVGVGIGLMVAPKSGRELRHELSSNIHDLGERSQHHIHDAAERARSRIENFRGNEESAVASPNTAEKADNPYQG